MDRSRYIPSPKVDGAVVEWALHPPDQRVAVPGGARAFLGLVRVGRGVRGAWGVAAQGGA